VHENLEVTVPVGPAPEDFALEKRNAVGDPRESQGDRQGDVRQSFVPGTIRSAVVSPIMCETVSLRNDHFVVAKITLDISGPSSHSVDGIAVRKDCLYCPLHCAPVQSIGVETIDCSPSKKRRLLGDMGYHFKITEITGSAPKPLALEEPDPAQLHFMSEDWGEDFKSLMPGMGGVLPWLASVGVVSPVVREGVSLRNDHLKVAEVALDNDWLSCDPGNGVTVSDYGERPEPLLGLEIKVDWWGKGCGTNNNWWQCFHAAVDDSDDAARKKMDGHDAIAIGLLTIDGNNYHAFNSAQSELHPVWALFIHTNPSRTDDTWAFFVRNSGDEGYCGNSQHRLFTAPAGQPQPLKVFLPMPDATGLTFLPSSKVNKSNDLRDTAEPLATNVVTGSGAVLTFSLGDPCREDRARCSWVEGDLHIRWDVAAPLLFRSTPRAPTSASLISREIEVEAPVPADVAAKSLV
jgi:hypothetical protein